MTEIDAAILIPSDNINNWGKDLNRPALKASLFDAVNLNEPFAYLNDEPIYRCYNRNNYKILEYFSFIEKRDNPEIVFYSQVKYNQKRNNLFKPKIGKFQSLVWKKISWQSGTNFAPSFILDILLQDDEELFPMVITDMKQTSYGSAMWIRTLMKAMKRGYKCYYGLSSPSDAKCIIKLTSVDDIVDHYEDDIVNENSAYAYRCALITKPNTKIERLLLDPKHTLILSNKEAEDLDAYTTPIELDNLQYDDMLNEYYAVK